MARSSLRRVGDHQAATTLELFYDLVFVFAITQVSHHLLEHLSWRGLAQSTLILLVVWWSWNYTTWVTNELDPESPVVRSLMIALMLGSLLMAVAIPEAFGKESLLFVLAYLGIQIGRHTFLTFYAADARTIERKRAGHILVWFCMAAVPWIAGALVDDEATRWILWLIALAIDYAGPLLTYRLPFVARVPQDAWHVSTDHFAERFGLFIIIALGETIVLTGATTSDLDLTTTVVVAFAAAFLTTAALWWLYFTSVARFGEQDLHDAANRVALARDNYTYFHVILVAGIIISAVGDELLIAHASEPLPAAEIATIVGGPALYLLGHALLRLRATRRLSPRRLGGALALVIVGLTAQDADGLVIGLLTLAVLVAVVAGDQVAAARRRRRLPVAG